MTCSHGAGGQGKQLWVELEKRPWPLIHLGMTGSFAAIDRLVTKFYKGLTHSLTRSLAHLLARSRIHCSLTRSLSLSAGKVHTAHYVNSKVDASSWPPKFWKFHMEMVCVCAVVVGGGAAAARRQVSEHSG